MGQVFFPSCVVKCTELRCASCNILFSLHRLNFDDSRGGLCYIVKLQKKGDQGSRLNRKKKKQASDRKNSEAK